MEDLKSVTVCLSRGVIEAESDIVWGIVEYTNSTYSFTSDSPVQSYEDCLRLHQENKIIALRTPYGSFLGFGVFISVRMYAMTVYCDDEANNVYARSLQLMGTTFTLRETKIFTAG